MRYPPFVLGLYLILLVAGAGACDKREAASGGQSAGVLNLTIIAESQDDATWGLWQRVAREAEQKDPKLKIRLVAPQTPSPRDQQELIQACQGGQVDVVCVAPTDPTALRGAIADLARTGVRVVTIGRDVADSDRSVYCGPDETEIGRAAAEACARAMEGDPAKTAMVLYAGEDDPIYGPRYRGFTKAMLRYPDLTLLRKVNCAQNRTEAVNLVRLESRKYPRTGCWVFLEDWPLRAASLDDQLVPKDCRVVLCNESPRYFALLRDGRISALIGFDYAKAAIEAIGASVQLGRHEAPAISRFRTMDVETVTADNLPEIERRWPAG